MRRRAILAIVVGCAAVVDVTVGTVSCSDAPREQDVAILTARAAPFDPDKPYTRDDYKFLDAAIGSASVVQLGESLHITAELPRVRLRVVQYLHEELGFDTLALEGSLTQTWLAQEHLLRSTDPSRIARAQEEAWFMLWRTPAMREVMAYVDATRSTPHPLYVTSFDIQVGTSAANQGGPGIITDLFDALRAYGPSPDPAREAEMQRGLVSIVRCGSHGEMLANRETATKAVDTLEVWIRSVAPRVQPSTHAIALGMIPKNFRDNIELCSRFGGSMRNWQEIRDDINARNVIELRDQLSTSHKVMAWAHHSHVMHNGMGTQIPSMGQHLHAKLGGELYTIGTFAGGGRVIDGGAFGERNLPSVGKVGVERMLAAVNHDAYFIDVSRLPTADASAGWLVEQRSRFESMSRPTVLAKDVDGAIYVAQVHPSAFSDSFVVRWLLRIWGFIIEHRIGFAILIVAGIGFGIRAIVRRIVRWRRSRR